MFSVVFKKTNHFTFDKHINDYDYAIIIRPDIRLDNKININYFNELNDNNIIIPIKGWYTGCNDRICIGKPNVISYCGKLFDELKIYSETTSIVSEMFFMNKLNENSINIKSKQIEYLEQRIDNSHFERKPQIYNSHRKLSMKFINYLNV